MTATASTTVLRWLLKTLMLKKKVLPFVVNDVVLPTMEMETSSLHTAVL